MLLKTNLFGTLDVTAASSMLGFATRLSALVVALTIVLEWIVGQA